MDDWNLDEKSLSKRSNLQAIQIELPRPNTAIFTVFGRVFLHMRCRIFKINIVCLVLGMNTGRMI